MRVLLTSEARFERTPDGVIWGSAPYGAAMWRRYLDVFTSALLMARVSDVRRPSPGGVETLSPGIECCPLPPYAGLSGLLRHLAPVRAAVHRSIRKCDAVIVRSPSPIAFLTSQALLAAGRPYAAQIVGDPDQVFSAGAFQHPLRIPLRRLATVAQQRLSRDATAVLFVTKRVLQSKYPTRGRAYSASDVSLDDSDYAPSPLRRTRRGDPFTVVTVASLDQPYKGTSVLLEAFARLRSNETTVRLQIVGAGRLMPALQRQARARGIGSVVEFLGQVDRDGVRQALQSSDLFVLPSFTEGLPRALLEAMAQGLPAVASNVGGIPELLPLDCLVPPGDACRLADAIEAFMASDRWRATAGERNRYVAAAYHEREQTAIRNDFLRSVAGDVLPAREAACV
jgi:glycosyltransferase involved in cell wall biosynthesis